MPSSRQIELAAASWLARRDAASWSGREQAQLDAWLDAATAHRIAFIRLESAWRLSGRLKALGAGIPEGALPAREAWPVSPLGDWSGAHQSAAAQSTHDTPATARSLPTHRSATPRRASWQRYAAVAALLLLSTSLVLGWRHYTAVDQATYHTALGGLQEVPLADGSKATMSSDSRILVTFSHGERYIDLERGEAFFEVARDPDRPFVVNAGNRRAIAVGTRFAVRRQPSELRVIVTEGLVRLESDRLPGGLRQPITLLPAGSVALSSDAGVTVRAGSVQQAEEYLSWRSGFIHFHDTPLSAAAAEFNRYNTRKIVIGDASVGALRVGGNFRWSNADTFVRLLEQGFPVRAVQRDDAIVLQRR